MTDQATKNFLVRSYLKLHGPVSTRVLLQLLNPDDLDEWFKPALMGVMSCPGTWRIDIGEDNGLVGLDSQEKPGDGSVEAAAASLGLVPMMGAWVPRAYLNGNGRDRHLQPQDFIAAEMVVGSLAKNLEIQFQIEGDSWNREMMQEHVNKRASLNATQAMLINEGERLLQR